MKRSYNSQKNWKDIQGFLPEELHFRNDYSPEEDYWEWRGHTVHLDRFRNPEATHKIIQLHGVGTNGRMMSSIVGGPLFKRGYETVAIDLLNYGETDVKPGHKVDYFDWVNQVVDFIKFERTRDSRPIILYGLSAGGMLAYQTACIDKQVVGIVAMCFMDMRMPSTARSVVRWKWLGGIGVPMIRALASIVGGLKLPMSLASKMSALVNDKEALKACLADKTSAGNWVSLNFMSSIMSIQPAVELENFDVCPILLTQPEKDTWTPLDVSTPVLDRINQVPTEVVMLDNAGHYPLEQPGLQQMEDAIVKFIENL